MALFDRFRKKRNSSRVRVALGAFGKHPAWADFMATASGVDTGLGVETPALIEVKRFLQNDGVLRFEERESWKELDRDSWLKVFQHVFVWRTRQDFVIGKLWSSFDSKGRRLPMFLAAEASGLSKPWVLREFLPRLGKLEAQLKAATNPAEVEAALGAARQECRALALSAPTPPAELAEGSLAVASGLAEHPEWGPDGTGLHRVLYQVDRDMSAFRKARNGDTSRLSVGGAFDAQQIRVPALGGALADEALAWSHLLLHRLSPSAPILALFPEGGPHIDLIVGAPGPSQLHCLVTDVPQPSSIPYELDAAFVQKAGSDLAGWRTAFGGGDHAPSPADSPKRSSTLRFLGVLCILVAAAVVISLVWKNLLDGAGGGAWADYTRAHDGWLGRFFDDLDRTRLERYGTDPDLKAWLAPYEAVRQAGRDTGPDASRADREALLDVYAGVKKILTPDGWRALDVVEEAKKRFRERGWERAASHLASVSAHVTPSPDQSLARSLDDVLTAARQVGEIDAAWQRLQIHLEALRSKSDFLDAFERQALAWTGRAGSPAGGEADLDALKSEIDAAERLGARLAGFVKESWPRVAVDRLPARLQEAPTADAGRDTFETWMREVRDFEMVFTDPRDDPRMASLLEGVESEIARLEAASPERAAPLRARLDEVRAKMETDRKVPAVAAESGTIARNASARVDELKALEKDLAAMPSVVAASPERVDWLRKARAETPTFDSEAVRRLEASWRQRLLDGVSDDRIATLAAAEFEDLRNKLDKLRNGLQTVEALRRLEAPGEQLAAHSLFKEIDAVCSREWDRAFEAAVKEASAVEVEALAQSAPLRKFAARRSELGALARDFVTLDQRLAGAFLLDDAAGGGARTARQLFEPWRESPLLSDPALQAVLSPLLRRLKALETVASLSERRKLLAWTDPPASGEPGEVVLAAWRRLPEVEGSPWPGNLRELEQERAIHASLQALFARVPDAGRRNALQAELEEEARKRWKTGFAALSLPAEAARATAMMPDFHVEESRLENPAVRFKVELARLAAALESNEGNALRDRAAAFLKGVESGVPRDFLAGNEQAGGIVREVKRLVDAAGESDAPTGAPAGPASALVPASRRWKQEAAPGDDGRVRFHWTVPGAAERRHALEFVRVGSSDASTGAVCIATTEVSVGLFIDVVSAADGWSRVASLMYDDGRGPQPWRFEDGPIVEATEWLRPKRSGSAADFYPPGRDPAPPSRDHPMQRLTPEAALYFVNLLGCRLPSAREWIRALSLDRQAGGGHANLRDRSWQIQEDHAERQGPAVPRLTAADMKFFVPEGFAASDAPGTSPHDEYLWFAPVASGKAARFEHLIGNVAEFVFDVPEKIGLTRKMSGRDLRRFVRAEAASFGVIGGSALSPPDLEREKALPIVGPGLSYSDVGVRLAFTTRKETPLEKLKEVVVDARYWSE